MEESSTKTAWCWLTGIIIPGNISANHSEPGNRATSPLHTLYTMQTGPCNALGWAVTLGSIYSTPYVCSLLGWIPLHWASSLLFEGDFCAWDQDDSSISLKVSKRKPNKHLLSIISNDIHIPLLSWVRLRNTSRSRVQCKTQFPIWCCRAKIALGILSYQLLLLVLPGKLET